MDREAKFLAAVATWRECLAALNGAAETYRVQHAKVYLAATGADAARKAAADAVTGELRAERDKCEVQERLSYHCMIYYRGSAGEAERV